MTLHVTVESDSGEVGLAAARYTAPQVGLHLLLVSLAEVQLSLPLRLKFSLTLLTVESKTPRMELEMRVEVVDCSEVLVAAFDVAAEILFTAMTQFVPVEFVDGDKCPVTARDVALEWFDVVMGEEMELELVSLAIRLLTVMLGTAPELLT